MSKLKQIAIELGTGSLPSVMWGLCRNGTLWMRELRDGDSKWLRVEGPPSAPAILNSKQPRPGRALTKVNP